jgi:hypothetical protein
MNLIQPEIIYGKWYIVDGDSGTEIIPGEYIDENLIKYVQKNIEENYEQPIPIELTHCCNATEINDIKIIEGFGAALSASELENNQWEIFNSSQEAQTYIKEYMTSYYGENEE